MAESSGLYPARVSEICCRGPRVGLCNPGHSRARPLRTQHTGCQYIRTGVSSNNDTAAILCDTVCDNDAASICCARASRRVQVWRAIKLSAQPLYLKYERASNASVLCCPFTRHSPHHSKDHLTPHKAEAASSSDRFSLPTEEVQLGFSYFI